MSETPRITVAAFDKAQSDEGRTDYFALLELAKNIEHERREHERMRYINASISGEIAAERDIALEKLTAMHTTAAKAMADYETANAALGNCKAVAEIQSERVRKLEGELAAMTATTEDYRIQACRSDECRIKTELAAMTADRDQWKAKYIQANKEYGCELRDPNGTIWSYTEELRKERDALLKEKELWTTRCLK
jgi:hypothetical protein